jgi:hypothetical protein
MVMFFEPLPTLQLVSDRGSDVVSTLTSGDVISLKCTPSASGTASILKIEADGANWTGGNCVELISDDANASFITCKNPTITRFQVQNDGDVVLSKDLTFNGSTPKIITTANTSFTFLPNGTGISIFGDAGSTSHSLNTNDDVFISGRLEVDGNTFFDSNAYYYQSLFCTDDVPIIMGSSGDWRLMHNTSQTVDSAMVTVGSESNAIILCQEADKDFDFAHAQQTNPTAFIHSSNQATNEWLSLTHNQTDGVIDCGTGTLNLGGTANVNFAGSSVTGSTVTHDAYVEMEVAGVLKKFMLGS